MSRKRVKVTIAMEEEGGPSSSSSVVGTAKKGLKGPPPPPPGNWELILENIRLMRSDGQAPVDVMGCERCMEQDVSPEVRRYQLLISLMLSSQTKDSVTYGAMERLKNHGLTMEKIRLTAESELVDLIKPVGFYRRKAGFIKKATEILMEAGDIPESVEGLMALPGVGPKMAFICANVAWGRPFGIGVDTHVHRISDRLGWSMNAKSAEETRKQLEGWLPKELWLEINALLVGFGQTTCLPLRPKCSECLNSKLLCPFSLTKNNKG